MREKMERLVLLPFSVGCVSESSIAVAVRHSRKSKADSNQSLAMKSNKDSDEEELFRDDESNISGESNKSSFRSLSSLPKPNISTGIHRLVKGFKTFSHYFVYKDEMEELDEMTMEMEIGGPTDVKHVTHIGWDGSSTTNEEALMGWQNLVSPDSNSVPWRPSFDLISMASQVVQPGQPHLLNSSPALASS